jgi:hypothetical protein
VIPGPLLFNAPGRVTLAGDTLTVSGVSGEPGTTERLLILRQSNKPIAGLRVNGREIAVSENDKRSAFLGVDVTFEGTRFRQSQQIGTYDPGFAGGTVTARFTIPTRVSAQLAARRRAWPIPWTAEDLETAWLAPERLLLYVQIAEPDDTWNVGLSIDGRPVELKKAYSAVRAVARTFVGFYADVSSLGAEKEHELTLRVPPLQPGQFQGVFFENVEREYTDKIK